MTAGWRGWAVAAGLIISLGGLVVLAIGSGPVLLIIGLLIFITPIVEPIYGSVSATPKGGHWRPTDEKFVDSETGKVVTVWFDPQTGDRRYVAADDTLSR